jgi:FdhD protein
MKMTDLPMPPMQTYRSLAVQGLRGGQHYLGDDSLAVEVPVALEFNGIGHAVMMASPADLQDFAYGFSLTEGIVAFASQIHDFECVKSDKGYALQLTIAASCFAGLKEKRRSLVGRTGCGLCGIESLEHALRPHALMHGMPSFSVQSVSRAVDCMRSHQLLLAMTGATHAAAWCNADGEIVLIREDVGRHNALDKLIGALMREKRDASQGFVTITSRASYEMVQKTASMQIGLLAAVSGVTSLAVDVARQTGLALAGFTRGNDMSIYTYHERFKLKDSHEQ